MNGKGQIGIGLILMVFVGVIVGLVLFDATLPFIGQTTNTIDEVNDTDTLAALNSTIELKGKSVSSLVVLNSTDNSTVSAGNYTVLNNQLNSNNELTAQLQSDDAQYAETDVRLSYTYEPVTYASDSGTRGVIGLIAILMAMAVFIVALSPTFRSGVLNMMSR